MSCTAPVSRTRFLLYTARMICHFEDFARQARARITAHTQSVLDRYYQDFLTITRNGEWLSSQLRDYSCSGKMLRGSLALLGAGIMGAGESEQALSLAAGLELLQAGLLIHDDIMDRDEQRRGKPTFHVRIQQHLLETASPWPASAAASPPEPSNSELSKVSHHAEAEGICAGDLCFFIAWEEIAKTSPQVSALVAKEHARVTLAQMEDVLLGLASGLPDLETVLRMYRHKTARYTVALPLMAGALLSPSASQSVLSLIEAYGENLGIVFQIQDDQLGLFGSQAQIGKPIGSDIREGKKTPYIIALVPMLSQEERQRFDAMFGQASLMPTESDMEWLRTMIVENGVDRLIQQRCKELVQQSRKALDALSARRDVDHSRLALLEAFLDYSLERTK